MLEFTDVTLTFPDGDGVVTALDAVSFTAARGVITGISGPSGSGKSSLLAVAATLIRPDSGTVTIDGDPVQDLSATRATELRRDRIGIVFQQANLLASLTAVEQLEVMGRLGQRPAPRGPAYRGRALELLDAVGLADHSHKRPHQLSGGQRQRVAIARALLNQPSVLLVDEPTSALDAERGAAVVDLLTRLTAERGTATVLVTHDPEALARLPLVRTMRDGQLA